MKLTILGVFYDGYKDLWEDFVNLFKKYWSDCPYEVVIVANTDNLTFFNGVKVISAGKDAEYSKKIKTAIATLKSDYYLLLLEDFFFSERIDNTVFEKLTDYIENEHIKYYSMPMNEFANNFKGKKIKHRVGEREISKNAKYTLSCQPAIWESNFLDSCIGLENYNAWVFEGIFCKLKVAHTDNFLKRCIANTKNPLSLLHGALQGRIVPSTYSRLIDQGYTFSTKRDVIPLDEYRKHLFKIKLRGLFPYWLQRMIRVFIKKKTIVGKYDNQIKHIIESRGLEQI